MKLKLLMMLVASLAFISLASAGYNSSITITKIDEVTTNQSYIENQTPIVYFTYTGNATSLFCNVTVNNSADLGSSALHIFNGTATSIQTIGTYSDNNQTFRVNCTNETTNIVNLSSLSFMAKIDNTTPSISLTKLINSTFLNNYENISFHLSITERWIDSITIGAVTVTANESNPLSNDPVTWNATGLLNSFANLAGNCTYTNITIVVTDVMGRTDTSSIGNITGLPCIETQNWTSEVSGESASSKAITFTFASDVAITGGVEVWMPNGTVLNSTSHLCNYSASSADVSIGNYTTKTNYCNINVSRRVGQALEVTIAPSTGLGTTAAASNWPNGLNLLVGLLVGAAGVEAWHRKYSDA